MMPKSLRTSAIVLFLFMPIGYVVIALGWWTSSRTFFIPFQVPALVSGGMVGVLLVATGGCLLSLLQERAQYAEERELMDSVLDEGAALIEAVRRSRS